MSDALAAQNANWGDQAIEWVLATPQTRQVRVAEAILNNDLHDVNAETWTAAMAKARHLLAVADAVDPPELAQIQAAHRRLRQYAERVAKAWERESPFSTDPSHMNSFMDAMTDMVSFLDIPLDVLNAFQAQNSLLEKMEVPEDAG